MSDRTSAGLREALFTEIEALRNGQSEPGRAKAVAAVAAQILKSVEIELMFRQQQHDLTDEDGTKPDELGSLTLARLPAPQESGRDELLTSGDVVTGPTGKQGPVRSPLVPPGPLGRSAR